ncbi:Scr1 family TA system antitoxin-like transcriptional regulator [Streptomyces sp. NPDC048441]|uniref:helix-turn-helix domain-containing protein n=1 Tax=Streptomyces sp. NPDC048441 TaxID=3365552 RepID=UPI00371D081C
MTAAEHEEQDPADETQDLDEETSQVLAIVGRHVRRWRIRAGLTQAELGLAIGYTEHQVSAVERGRRIPKPEFLDKADRALNANGMLAALKEDLREVRYPKKVRDLAKLEADAVELGAYAHEVVHGLLQTEDYIRALFQMRTPLLDEETIERHVSARLARQEIFGHWPAPVMSFVQEEVTLRRPVGGRMVLRAQLERLLEVGQLRNVQIQVMPTGREENAGLGGSFRLIEPQQGSRVAHTEVQQFSRVTADRKSVRVLEARYGIIRAQALTPRESLTFIERVLGET